MLYNFMCVFTYIHTYVHIICTTSLPVLSSVIAQTVLLGLVIEQEVLVGDCTVLVIVGVVLINEAAKVQ